MPRLLCAFALTLSLSPTLRADWPEFRGPTGQGHADAKNPPTEWGPTKNVAWNVTVPGKGWASPVVAGGKVFLTTAVPQGDGPTADQSLRALAFDAATGKTVWDVEVFKQDGKTAPKIHAKNSHASPTPAVDGDRVYVHFGHQGIACRNADTGANVWANRDLTYTPVHGNGGSPVVSKDKVFVCIDGPGKRELAAFDKFTGKVLWEAPRTQPAKKAFSFCTPLVVNIAGKEMVVAPGSDVVNGFDPDTGKELWALPYSGYSVVPRPVFAHGLLFLSTSYDTASLLVVKVEPAAGGKFAAKIVWQTNKDAPHNPAPLVVGDELFTVSDAGIATCYDAKTGKIHWKERQIGQYTSAPVYAAGRVYLQNEAGIGVVLKASKEYEPIAANRLGERSLASYGVDGNAFLIRTETQLYRISGK
ncbi:MAG: PQQ-binding-like beta-propeller repeat protein [Fimbriiglobus sp.]